MNLELTDKEEKVLKELLEEVMADLSMEISHTDSSDYRAKIKERREILKNIADKL